MKMSKESLKQKEAIVNKLKTNGCKEIYYRASKIDNTIGTATVYRMINTLEKIGAIDRKNMYKVQVS